MKYYVINDAGEVVEGSRFDVMRDGVEAKTKTEATKKFLLRAKHCAAHSPKLYIKNGAFNLVSPNAMEPGKFISETGSLNRVSESGWVAPLCIVGHDSESKALKESSFTYYASEEFQAGEK